jgi:hypothetical protein
MEATAGIRHDAISTSTFNWNVLMVSIVAFDGCRCIRWRSSIPPSRPSEIKFKMDGHERCVPKRPSFVNLLIAALAGALMFVFNYEYLHNTLTDFHFLNLNCAVARHLDESHHCTMIAHYCTAQRLTAY